MKEEEEVINGSKNKRKILQNIHTHTKEKRTRIKYNNQILNNNVFVYIRIACIQVCIRMV